MHVPSQDFLDELAARVNTLQNQNAMLLSQMAGAAKLLNAAVVENQILKAELHALDTNGTPKPAVSPAWGVRTCFLSMDACRMAHGDASMYAQLLGCMAYRYTSTAIPDTWVHGVRSIWRASMLPMIMAVCRSWHLPWALGRHMVDAASHALSDSGRTHGVG